MIENAHTEDLPGCEETQRALRLSAEAAADAGVRAAIAVVNASGVLAGFLRMPGSFLASVDYAQWKAWTAASFDMSTAEFGTLLNSVEPLVRDGLLAHPKATPLPGGFPVRLAGRMIGAIGVSGGSGEEDEIIARAGLAAFAA